MLIPYPYIPATQDLWLYEDYEVSWTFPTPSSFMAKRPIAWNPDSPLYGYRDSLRGISAQLRTFSTAYSDPSLYYPWNDPNDPANKPAFFNSYPPHVRVASPLFIFACRHCGGSTVNRDPLNRVVGNGGYAVGSMFEAVYQYRWLNSDNQEIVNIPPTEIMLGYSFDPPTNFAGRGDLGLTEFLTPQLVPPVQFVDPRSVQHGATAWLLDGSQKIVRLKFTRSYVTHGTQSYAFEAVSPDGSTPPIPVQTYMHDSGSIALIEISPPSSPSAGDGIMGIIPAHIVYAGELVNPAVSSATGYFDVQADGYIANPPLEQHVASYCADRGYPVMPVLPALRGGALALQSVEEEILALLEGIP